MQKPKGFGEMPAAGATVGIENRGQTVKVTEGLKVQARIEVLVRGQRGARNQA